MGRVNILVAGVGGQGLITMASILAKAGLRDGTKVLVAETHGLSQRGGAVEVHVRMGDVESPLIPRGGADVIVALELLEAIRGLVYAGRSTRIVVNKRLIRPNVPGTSIPPLDEILSSLKGLGLPLWIVPATELAIEAGSSVATNMVMLGALLATGTLDGYVSPRAVERVILEEMHPRWRDINIRAFKMGYGAASKQRREP